MFKNIVKLGNETERRAEFEKNKAKVCRRGGLYKAAKQLGSEAAKQTRCKEAKSISGSYTKPTVKVFSPK